METLSQKIHISPIIQHKYCTKTYKSARLGTKMSQMSNSCVSIFFLKKNLDFRSDLNWGDIYTKGMALVAFRIFVL